MPKKVLLASFTSLVLMAGASQASDVDYNAINQNLMQQYNDRMNSARAAVNVYKQRQMQQQQMYNQQYSAPSYGGQSGSNYGGQGQDCARVSGNMIHEGGCYR